ncbi:hypothetical protein SAMN05421853_11310 [Roseivivax halotolerans]|uniref:Uncharacterized protein n=1 Tax=Roseivivax halotolerans TaxID=93684 RepID=A0A1I5ZXE8_9RHOB|nr:hypothetical protein [Roseivivax halotolerans]SFQ61144.1 hypothetical protein SAMN05421853_11310 [Roseivivax halotolerans]
MLNKSVRDASRTFWHVQRVKRMIRGHLGRGAQCLVSVQQAYCSDPGCEGFLTEIRIVQLGFQEMRTTLHKPVADVSEGDIAAIF